LRSRGREHGARSKEQGAWRKEYPEFAIADDMSLSACPLAKARRQRISL